MFTILKKYLCVVFTVSFFFEIYLFLAVRSQLWHMSSVVAPWHVGF